MQENNSIIIAMLEELLTISKRQRPEQTVNANVDLTPIKDLIENGIYCLFCSLALADSQQLLQHCDNN